MRDLIANTAQPVSCVYALANGYVVTLERQAGRLNVPSNRKQVSLELPSNIFFWSKAKSIMHFCDFLWCPNSSSLTFLPVVPKKTWLVGLLLNCFMQKSSCSASDNTRKCLNICFLTDYDFLGLGLRSWCTDSDWKNNTEDNARVWASQHFFPISRQYFWKAGRNAINTWHFCNFSEWIWGQAS